MLNSRYSGKFEGERPSKSEPSGFAISVDALLATIVAIALIGVVGIGIEKAENPPTISDVDTGQMVDDAFTTLDNSGTIMNAIEGQGVTAEELEQKIEKLLPKTVEFKTVVRSFEADLTGNCRTTQAFEDCFPEREDDPATTDIDETNPKTVFDMGETTIPEGKEVLHGSKILIKNQPGDCEDKSEEAGFLPSLGADRQTAYFGGATPEAKDVVITTDGDCSSPAVNTCPGSSDIMRCCYTYVDDDTAVPYWAQYQWLEYNEVTGEWVQEAGETDPTLPSSKTSNGQLWKCTVRVQDEEFGEWSDMGEGTYALIGGPCFTFSSTTSKAAASPYECGQSYNVDISLSAEGGTGGTRAAADIMLVMDRSGSMSWIDEMCLVNTNCPIYQSAYDGGGGIYLYEAGVPDLIYFGALINGTSDMLIETEVDDSTGKFNYTGKTGWLSMRHYGGSEVFADADYVYAAEPSTAGLTVFDRATMQRIRTFGGITSATAVAVQGNYIYLTAVGYGISVPPVALEDQYAWNGRYDTGYEQLIGFDATQSYLAQSFKPGADVIEAVSFKMAWVKTRDGTRPGDLVVHIRETINGPDLPNGTATIPENDIDRSTLQEVLATFPGAINVVQDQTYYLVVEAPSSSHDGKKYVKWASESVDIYPEGDAFSCTSAGVCTQINKTLWFNFFHYGTESAGLVVYDKSDPNPSNWFKAGEVLDNPGLGVGPMYYITNLDVQGNYVYVTQDDLSGYPPGIWIVDVSNPASPQIVGFEQCSSTGAWGVDVEGSYAYVACDGTLDVVDVSNPANPVTVGSVAATGIDVAVYDTNAYMLYQINSINNYVRVVDVSNPNNPVLAQNYQSPYFYSDIKLGENFIYTSNARGLMSVERLIGPKLNFAKAAGSEFIFYSDWTAPEDQLGLASFGSYPSGGVAPNATLDSNLMAATEINKGEMATKLNAIKSVGPTPINLGLNAAVTELTGPNKNPDPEAIRIAILLSDGVHTEGFDSLKAAVDNARANKVHVFTIGFGEDVNHEQLQYIADESYCGESGTECGSYQFNTDPYLLDDVYDLIRQQIGSIITEGGEVDAGTTDIAIDFSGYEGAGSGFSGIEITNISPGAPTSSWDGGTDILAFTGIDITALWNASFTATIPCNYTGCGQEFYPGKAASFPPPGTEIDFTVSGNPQTILWPPAESEEGEFYYNDLQLGFISGKLFSLNDVVLDYVISNVGYYDEDLGLTDPTMQFYKGQDALTACSGLTDLGYDNYTDLLDAGYGDLYSDGLAGGFPANTSVDKSSNVSDSGWLCLWLNKDPDIPECGENNQNVVYCGSPGTVGYTIDYWVWEK